MPTPLRVSDKLFQEAEAEAFLLNRSTAKQIEFWAKLGKQLAQSITPADMLALMQGIAEVRIQIPASQAINPENVFAAVDKKSSTEQLGRQITRNTLYYEASKTRSGLLDQVMPDGTRRTGRFNNGNFLPE